jgi:hypothetical protein
MPAGDAPRGEVPIPTEPWRRANMEKLRRGIREVTGTGTVGGGGIRLPSRPRKQRISALMRATCRRRTTPSYRSKDTTLNELSIPEARTPSSRSRPPWYRFRARREWHQIMRARSRAKAAQLHVPVRLAVEARRCAATATGTGRAAAPAERKGVLVNFKEQAERDELMLPEVALELDRLEADRDHWKAEARRWRIAHGSVVAAKRNLSAKYGAIMRRKPRARLRRAKKNLRRCVANVTHKLRIRW